ncbi:tetratricopeptide repeat protein [Aquimarina sp. M1]
MKNLLIVLLCFQFGIVFSQEEGNRTEIIAEANQYVATGNEVLVKDGNFPKAEGEYRKAISTNPVDATAKYNLANAYYNTEKYDEANQRYTEAVKTATSKTEKHKAFHNQGNTYMEQKKYKEAVEAYKNALRNNPKDDETRYNLALAKQLLEKQKNEDKGGDKDNKDKNKDENKDKENKDKKEGEDKEDKKEGEDDKDKKGDEGEEKKDEKGEDKKDEEADPKDEGEEKKKDKKEGDGKPEEQKKQPQQVQGQLSPQQVKSLLEAMNNEEKKVQDKINAKKAQGAKTKTEKDW